MNVIKFDVEIVKKIFAIPKKLNFFSAKSCKTTCVISV